MSLLFDRRKNNAEFKTFHYCSIALSVTSLSASSFRASKACEIFCSMAAWTRALGRLRKLYVRGACSEERKVTNRNGEAWKEKFSSYFIFSNEISLFFCVYRFSPENHFSMVPNEINLNWRIIESHYHSRLGSKPSNNVWNESLVASWDGHLNVHIVLIFDPFCQDIQYFVVLPDWDKAMRWHLQLDFHPYNLQSSLAAGDDRQSLILPAEILDCYQ